MSPLRPVACAFPALAETIAQSPAEQARRLFFDTLVYDATTLKHLTQDALAFGNARRFLGRALETA